MAKSFLKNLNFPEDLKKLSYDQLSVLCSEIREQILKIVSENGGHLSSNLGSVELTVALYLAFDFPKDNLVWDVGHQSYTHKILSGRLNKMHTIRKQNGLSGFPKKSESPFDSFDVGHSSTSISAALGLAEADFLLGKDSKTIAVIGDGALSGGLAFEGLNNAGRFKKNFIVVLNDNKMSISKNVGALSLHLAKLRTNTAYVKTKGEIEKILNRAPIIGETLINTLKNSKTVFRKLLCEGTIFEKMGYIYYGPIDGHDIKKMVRVFNIAQKLTKPVLIHVITKKGKGYTFAEKNSIAFHGVSNFNINTGESLQRNRSFSAHFGEVLYKLAQKDKKICAITAAMASGTGLDIFAKNLRDRFFDVGIAEEHAVTFAGALAVGGMKPVFAVYSTFLQRAYDQLLHDVSMQNANVTIAVDRAGIVGEDGETHQGIFDVPMLNSIPNTTIFAPAFLDEISDCLCKALYQTQGLSIVRYPRGGELYKPNYYNYTGNPFEILGKIDCNLTIITYGRLFSLVAQAYESLLNKGINVKLVKLNKIKPLDSDLIKCILSSNKIFFFEESSLSGSCAELLGCILFREQFKGDYYIRAIKDGFIKQATTEESLQMLGFSPIDMESFILSTVNKNEK